MSNIYRRCGCRTADGRLYGVLPVKDATDAQRAKACPRMLAEAKHGSFSWRLSNGFDPVTGKRVVVNGGTFPNLRAAQTALNAAKVDKDQHRLQRPTQQTLAAYAAEWLPRRQTTGKRPLAATTAQNYRRYIEQDITPSRLGRTKLSDIRRGDVQAFLDGLTSSGRGATTVNRILATVQAILTGAVRDELLAVNVARGIDGPTVERHELQVWEPAQLLAFLTVAGEHRLGAAFELATHTALRRGELCGLRWRDVDLERGVALVANNRVKLDGATIEKRTKNDSSTAEVELSPAAAACLQGWRLRQQLEQAEWAETWQDSGHVFTMEDGRPLDPAYLTRLFEKLRRRAESALRDQQRAEAAARGLSEAEVESLMQREGVQLPKLTLHGLRHCAASFMWDATGDLLAVSKALRHSSPAVTGEVYTHMKRDKQRATFGTIAEQLAGAGEHTLHTQRGLGA